MATGNNNGYVEVLTPVEVAQRLGVDRCYVTALIRSGRLKATDMSHGDGKKARWFIRADDLEEFAKTFTKGEGRGRYKRVKKTKTVTVEEVEETTETDQPEDRLMEIKSQMAALAEKLFQLSVEAADLAKNL